MEPVLDNHIIRNSEAKELANYLRVALNEVDSEGISRHLLAAVASESVPPRVFSVWLDVCHDLGGITDALRQPHSRLVRKIGIKCFARLLRTKRMGEAWSAAGDTRGILDLLSRLSVNEVKLFCKFAGATATSTFAVEDRQQKISELLQCLAHDAFPDAKLKSNDRRPLLRHYSHLLPACTSHLVKAWLANETLPTVKTDKLHYAHPALFQTECIEEMQSDSRKELAFDQYRTLYQFVPPLPTDIAGLSASMKFSVEVLQSLQADSELWFNANTLHDSIMVPLSRRLWTRKCPPKYSLAVVGTLLDCLHRHGDAATLISLEGRTTLVYFIARMWSSNPTLFQDTLATLFRITKLDTSSSSVLLKISDLMDHVKHRHRLAFLKTALMNHRVFRIDLDDDNDLRASTFKWPIQLFQKLLRKNASALVQRLVALHPEGDFLSYPRVTPDSSIFAFAQQSDPILLQLMLSRASVSAVQVAEATIAERKQKATTSREQYDRAYWAEYAILCAIASGSLQLLEKTLLWARRFNRDHSTVGQIYQRLATSEAVDLLRGFPNRPSITTSTSEDVCRAVAQGNQICKLLFETACMVLREPDFAAHDWIVVVNLFRDVVKARLEAVNRLQIALSIADSEVYDAIWRDTLETCIELERVGLEEGRERLGCNRQGGLLERDYISLVLKSPSLATLRFIDELAKRRNNLWEQYRPTLSPSVVALHDPWPRGLPVQRLFPFVVLQESGYHPLPYLESRVQRALFPNPAEALEQVETDDSTRDAIGTIVDDYKFALEFWINQRPDGAHRRQRAEQAWQYALERLTFPRMSVVEGVRFWTEVFENAGVDLNLTDIKTIVTLDLELPEVSNTSEPIEWNPGPLSGGVKVDSRPLDPSCLDSMLSGRSSPFDTAQSRFVPTKPKTAEVSAEPFWSRVSKRRPRNREVLVATALLLLDARRSAGSRLLSHPFPNEGDVRYPALFLDQDFLDRKGYDESDAIQELKTLRRDVPSILQNQLVESMLSSAKDQHSPWITEQDAFTILGFLVSCDRPVSALSLVKAVILERPDDSSWHRHLLHKGLLNNMSAADAKRFIERLSSDINEKLQLHQKSEFKGSATSEIPMDRKQVTIKVTTIKLLAEVLSGADFVDPQAAIDILARLLVSAKHLDVRVAVIESLSQMLVATRDDSVEFRILDTFKLRVIPIAAAVNEREPMTEADWSEAEADGNVPEVYDVQSRTSLPPVLDALMRVLSELRRSGKEELARAMLESILLPTLQLQAAQNKRWMRMFLRKLEIGKDTSELPNIPSQPQALAQLISSQTHITPASVLDTFAAYVLTNLKPPIDLIRANELILGNSSLRTSNAGKQWLALWNNTGNAALSIGGCTLPHLLTKTWTESSSGITHAQVRRHLLEQIMLVVSKGSDAAAERDSLLKQLGAHPRNAAWYWANWVKWCRPLVAEVVERVDAQRNESWQHNHARNPDVLPDTFGMRLWLLSYPTTMGQYGHDEKRAVFASELSDAIDSLANDTRPYHERALQVRASALKADETDYIPLALKLIHLESRDARPTLADWLRIDIVEALLLAAHMPREGDHRTVQEARDLLAKWKRSPIEGLRMKGFSLAKSLATCTTGPRAWFNEPC